MILSNNIIKYLLLSLNFIIQLAAQPAKIKFEQIGLEQGLSQSTVNAIVQDAQGFIWFGTQDGLNRYDGYSIKVFKHNPQDLNSLSDDRINCLISDSKGDLWIGTSTGGLDRYDVKKGIFTHYVHNINDSLTISDNTITVLFEDSKENIWIGTNNGLNLYVSQNNTFDHFFFDSKYSTGLSANSITAICEDKDNNLWVGTQNGLFKYNLKADSVFIKIKGLNSKPTTQYGENITSLYADQSGFVWIGTFDQVLKSYNKEDKTFIRFKNTAETVKTILEDSERNLWLGSATLGLGVLNRKTGNISHISTIQNDPINTLYEDKNGLIWIGTSFRGAFVYDQKKNRFKHYLEDPHNPNVVMTILEDQDGGLWVGTYGNGLKYFNKKRDKIKHYRYNAKDPNSISSDKIFTLCITSDGILWVGTIGGGLNYFDKLTGIFKRFTQHFPIDSKGLSNNDITALYETNDGNLWIGNVTGGIDILNRKTKTFSHYYSEEKVPNTIGAGRSVTVIREDENGTIWAGTLNGLKQFNTELNSFVSYNLKRKAGKQNTENESVTSLLFTGSTIWVGASRNGLLKFNPGSGSLNSYTSKDGLPDNVVLGILSDNSGNLWLSTNKGISRFNPESETFKNYDVNDGLQAMEFNQGAYYKSESGELFFGGVNGFNAFYPEEIKDNAVIPSIYLTKFSVFNQELNLPNPIPKNYRIELSYFQNFFAFEFIALDYTVSEKNQYAYILEGFDNEWHIVSSQQRYASYTNLDPGEYRLRVKGSNNDGLWNEEGTSIVLIIQPPFWMAWWFRGLGVFLIMLLVYFIYKSRVAKIEREKLLQQEISKRLIEKQEEERQRIALEIHDSLGPNLILIKNRANSSMKNKLDYKAISARFSQISVAATDVISTVREISHNLRPPELDQLGLTETLRSILITARSSTNIEITGEVENIDGLIRRDLEINFVRVLQEALSNVIKHSESKKCEIIIKIKENRILLSIDDNGKGFIRSYDTDGKKNKPGLGLTGMTERVRILGGNFKVETDPGKGTKIRIEVPINDAQSKDG